MWPGPISKKFGSTTYETLNDGQGNKIAIFPTVEQGAAAQFALWASSGYLGKTLRAAIQKWSGANSSAQYAASLAHAIPDLSLDTVITLSFLKSENGWRFMKVQAQWEAGQVYPMTDAQWQAAQKIAFPDIVPVSVPQSEAKPTPPVQAEPKKSLLFILISFLISLFKKK